MTYRLYILKGFVHLVNKPFDLYFFITAVPYIEMPLYAIVRFLKLPYTCLTGVTTINALLSNRLMS